MSSITESGYASLRETKRRLNITDSIISTEEKINDYMREADNYVNTQISVHVPTAPVTNVDAELVSLSSSLAAALFNYWQTPMKDRNLSAITSWKNAIQDHLKAAYGRYSASGLGGKDLFGTTKGFKP
jgi:hypothetical protein